jgi:hypothetical protein
VFEYEPYFSTIRPQLLHLCKIQNVTIPIRRIFATLRSPYREMGNYRYRFYRRSTKEQVRNDGPNLLKHHTGNRSALETEILYPLWIYKGQIRCSLIPVSYSEALQTLRDQSLRLRPAFCLKAVATSMLKTRDYYETLYCFLPGTDSQPGNVNQVLSNSTSDLTSGKK